MSQRKAISKTNCLVRNNQQTHAGMRNLVGVQTKRYMAVTEILFKELPFRPDRNQVFYIENGYDEVANDFIHRHYFDLKSMFSRIGMDFYYLPYLLRERDIEAKVRYYAPYLSPKLLVQEVQSNAFVPYISGAGEKAALKPSFLFEGRQDGYLGDVKFLAVAFESIIASNVDIVEQLMHLVISTREAFYVEEQERRLQESRKYETERHSMCCEIEENMACPSAAPESDSIPIHEKIVLDKSESRKDNKTSSKPEGMPGRLFNRAGIKASFCYNEADEDETPQKAQEEIEEEQSLKETAEILRDLRMTVQRLRLEGVSLMAIHEFIDKQEPLSRMIITPDYRIFLPDYNNMEIEMGALPKAIYFLYLRYPEGIVYKHMPDYFSELLYIYKQLRPNTDEARLNLTITKVVNPLGNALNENIARIRKAFVEKFDEHLANNYIISGERGSEYSIPLDRDMITWEE